MRKFVVITLFAAIGLGALSTLLYERYIGFAREPLERSLPVNTIAFISVDHWRQSALRVAMDEQARASARAAQGIALILADALMSMAPDTASIDLDPDLLKEIGSHFKGQVALAALPPSESNPAAELDWTLMAHFSGDPDQLYETLVKIGATQEPPEDLRASSWTTEHWQDLVLRSLPLPELPAPSPGWNGVLPWEDLALSWTVDSGVFHLALGAESLKRAVEQVQLTDPAESLAQRVGLNDIVEQIETPDLRLFIDLPSALELANRVKMDVVAPDPAHLMRAVALPRFFEAAGLAQTDSLAAALQFTGEQKSYLGLRYLGRQGIWNALGDGDPPPAWDRPADLGSFETLPLNAGQAILEAKSAFFAASPLAALAYWGVSAKLQRDYGYNVDTLLSSAFAHGVRMEHAIDVGTRRNAFGYIRQAVALDSLYTLALRADHPLEEASQRIFSALRDRHPLTVSVEQIRDQSILYYDADPDPTLTADRMAVTVLGDQLLIGRGTLGRFHAALELREPLPTAISSPTLEANLSIGWGALQIRHPASRLRLIAEVLFRQAYPGQAFPADFNAFDWSQLDLLEQVRISTTYDDGEGHLFRVSQRQ